MARKILLADDSVTAQNMGRKILTDAGYDVITVNNGSAALKRVNEQKPDLIVLDVYMPGYSGLEVCARLKDSQETARIPILLTVGKLEPFKPEEANRVKADGFIVKPFEASELLSALTRLEDRMVPQAEGARFSTTVSGIERFNSDPAVRKSGSEDESDTGWKNRLRFPSKKKKEEPEPEPEPDFVTPPSFRDYRRGGKAPASATFPVSATPAVAQEPGLVPDIPRDITPEELDALSELVAKLDGPVAAENVAPLGEKIGPFETPVTPTPAQAESEAEAPAAAAEVKKEFEVAAPAEAKSEAEVPAATPTEAAATESAPVVEAAGEAEPSAAAEVPVETTAAVAQEPAPVDRTDEPMFASASAAAEVQAEEKHEAKAEAAASSEPAASMEAAPAETAAAESKVEEVAQVEESSPAVPVTTSAKEAVAEPPAPSAEELAEALRVLTPSQTQTLAEAGAALVEELARGAGAGSRWVAEAVALSSEEASLSLEAEMFRTFASASEGGPAGNADGSPASAVAQHEQEQEEAAEAAVEAAEVRAEVASAVAAEESAAGAMTGSTEVHEQVEPEHRDSHAKTEEAAQQEVAVTTFADAVGRDEAESVAARSAEYEEVSSSEDESGGQEAMGTDAKKGGKSNWHQIRSGAPAAAATDVVEAAKQAEEAPKAMAAAASADGTDASAIASIVDSVLADLRPKIVEEIAKKLAKK